MTSVLPYWDRNLELNIVTWFPYGIDYTPVVSNVMTDPLITNISSLAFEMDSELLHVKSFLGGYGGTLARHNQVDPLRNKTGTFGFSIVFSYSAMMEQCLLIILSRFQNLQAGITLCSIFKDGVLVDENKVILVSGDDLIFDEKQFFVSLEKILQIYTGKEKSNTTFFAEKFGYRRFTIAYETDDIMSMRISQALFDFEFDTTREFVGPMPEVAMSPLMADIVAGENSLAGISENIDKGANINN